MSESENSDSSQRVVQYLSLKIVNQSPNQKYRFTIPDPEAEGVLYVADLTFAKNDDSIYLMPHITREYTIQVPDVRSGQLVTLVMKPGQDLHVSLHESGAINLTAGRDRVQLRRPGQERSREGKMVQIAVNAVGSLRRATLDEVNSLSKDCTPLSLMGLPGWGPIFVEVHRIAEGRAWNMPVLADAMQMHFEIGLRGKKLIYHFVTGQNADSPATGGDVAFWM